MRNCSALIAGILLISAGCAADVASLVEGSEIRGPLVVGRMVVALTGETSRLYSPRVRFFELERQQTHERFTVDISSDDRHFVIALPAGDYRLNRVQISEGPFMSMADVSVEFSVGQEPVTYVGTWRFGVDSPRYGRTVSLSMVMDQNDRLQAEAFLFKQYPVTRGILMAAAVPEPSAVESRLYEVMPYPRYPRYFRRHNW